MRSMAALFVLVSSSVAGAESLEVSPGVSRSVTPSSATTNRYFGANVSLGEQREEQVGFSLDGGTRIGESAVFVRAQGTVGRSGSSTDGHYEQLRVGAEMRGCLPSGVCAFAGGDAGYQHDNAVDEAGTLNLLIVELPYPGSYVEAHDAIVVPRAGVEMGREVRFRTSCETPIAVRLDQRGTGIGVACSAGIGFGF